MLKLFSRLPLLFLCLIPLVSRAQQDYNPELKRMEESARSFLNRGDHANAIMMYNQAIRLAPGDVPLRRDLAYAYFLSGNAQKAKEVIDPVLSSGQADEQTYQVAGAVENVLGNTAKARRILNQGLSRFPNSGILYNSRGNILNAAQKSKDALKSWNKGIEVEPGLAINYYHAAKYYHVNDQAVWALIYGEIFVNLEPGSARSSEIKKLIIDAYRKLFSPGKEERLPSFNKSAGTTRQEGFEALFTSTMLHNATAISDGLQLESLIMLRTRFILDWNRKGVHQYPFTLFTYHDKLLREGHFDAYNQWLFGAVDNSQAFSLWIKTNNKAYSAFETWFKRNPLQPAAYDPKPTN